MGGSELGECGEGIPIRKYSPLKFQWERTQVPEERTGRGWKKQQSFDKLHFLTEFVRTNCLSLEETLETYLLY